MSICGKNNVKKEPGDLIQHVAAGFGPREGCFRAAPVWLRHGAELQTV